MSVAVAEIDAEVLPKILVVEDDPSLREAVMDTLALADYHALAAANAETALQLLEKRDDIAMIVSDVNMGELSGHDLLHQVKKVYPHIPVLLVTAYASISDSVDAIRNGAIDYLVKPFEPKALLDIVAKQLDGRAVTQGADEPVASATESKQLLQLAKRMAQTDSTVLIIGESGTGKEVLARYIHQHSSRAKQPFIAINCAAIPENMLEAMLFGYEKGAYTGAYNSAPGKFEQANGGTLLLDEISEMDMGLQAKLLRVLQEREVERLGGRKTIDLDVRVIATSNRNMQQQVSEGQFREDLYYRLSVLPLQWQPLRARRDDILPLAKRLLHKHATKQKRVGVALDESAEQALFHYNWPGNVRELDNVIQRALILQTGNVICEADLSLTLLTEACNSVGESLPPTAGAPTAAIADTNGMPSAMNSLDGLRQPDMPASETLLSTPKQPLLGDDLKKREFEIIVETMREEKGSRKNTAGRLGISPRTLRYKLAKMREAGLDIDEAMDMV